MISRIPAARGARWLARIAIAASLVVPAAVAAVPTPTFNTNCSGCHANTDPGRANASYNFTFIRNAINNNYGAQMGSLVISDATLGTIATELGDNDGVSPMAATANFQTATPIPLAGKLLMHTANSNLDSLAVTVAGSVGSATVNTTSGAESITFTPAACRVGLSSFTYQATSSTTTQATSVRTVNVNVGNPSTGPVFTSGSSMSAQTGAASTPFTFTVAACPSLVTYTLAAGALPTGMNLSAGGVISGTPAASNTPGAYPVTVRATYTGGQFTNTAFTVNLALGQPDLSGSAATATGLEGTAIATYQIVATNGTVFTYTATGLPPGLVVSASSGQITGTPIITANTGASTVYPVTIGANNGAQGNTRVVNFTINAKPVVSGASTANGQTGVPFTYQIVASKTPTSYSAAGLPAGLNPPNGSGQITGIPTTVGGPTTVAITATNSSGTSAVFNLDITITLGPPAITSSLASQSAGEGQAFSYQITASNSPTSFNATGLPSGLVVNPATGLISGTPAGGSAAGSPYTVTISATNGTGTGSSSFTLNLSQFPPLVTSAGSASGQTGVPFTYQITGSNAPTSFSAAGLPPGLAVNGSGLVSGTPTAVGTFTGTMTVTNGSGTDTKPLVITIALGPPVVTSAATASGAAGFAFSYQITATNSPASFNATGLPPGVTVNTATGLLSGTPTANGTYNVTLSATNATATATKALVITISFGLPAITSPATATTLSGTAFAYQVTATNAPTSFNAVNLPSGLSINAATGLITGQVAIFGTYDITLQATNATGTGSRALTLVVSQAAPGLTSASSASGSVGQPFSYLITVANGPASFSVTGLPPGLSLNASSGLISGTPTAGGTFTATISISNVRATVTAALVITIGFQAPTVQDAAVEVVYETPTPIALPVTGQVSQVTIVSLPNHGIVTVNGVTATYTPANGYSGEDSFTYTASNPAGTTQAATVRITIGTLVPTASAATLLCDINKSATVDLAKFVKGSGITGVSIGAAPRHGKASVNGMQVTYTPATDYFGADSFTYVAFGNAGKSAPAAVSVTVVGRPDPTLDGNVTGLIDAQAQAARRFSGAQLGNYQRRMESLHRTPAPDGGTRVAEAAQAPAAPAGRVAALPAGGETTAERAPTGGWTPVGLLAPLAGAASTRAFDLGASSGGGPGRAGWNDGVSAWIAGTAQFGRRDARNEVSGLDFSTDGISVGVDRRVGERLVLGLGLGYGRDDTEVGTRGSRSKVKGQSFALYGSWQPGGATFIDMLAGIGSLDFDSRRYVTALDQFASGTRKGDQRFFSLSGGAELRRDGVLISPYGRLDISQDRLKSYSESGVGDYALAYDTMRQRSAEVAAGLRVETQHDADFGSVQPRFRAEYRRELRDDARATLRYADLLEGPQYTVTSTGVSRNALLLGVGSDFVFRGGLKIGIDYMAQRAAGAGNVQSVRMFISQDLDAKGSPFAWQPRMLKDPVGVEAGYTFDDNVTRGREASEKRSDSLFSLAAGEPIPVSLANPHLRLVITPSFSGDKFRRYQGLGRFSAGAQGELQYRASGAFDATTWALVGRAAYDQYESEFRRGARYFLGANARRALTDRIDVFAEAGRAVRNGKSEVFQTREWLGKLNLDYSLGRRGMLYVSGEYRRGDSVSTGPASLVNVGLAEVFVPDDAFEGLNLFSYRFEARTLLGTIGWNYPLGPRDSLDFSVRRAQSTPTQHTVWDSGTLRYIDNQYSLVYLMRF